MVTVSLHAFNADSQPIVCRALLDTCSTVNFVTESLATRLRLPRKKCAVPIGALDATTTVTKHLVTVKIRSKQTGYERNIDFLTVPQITQLVPDQPIDRSIIKIPQNIKMADPSFHRPASIDMLLGAGTTLSTLCVGKIALSTEGQRDLFLQKTLFGWVIGGSTPSKHPSTQYSCHSTAADLNFDLTKFWEIEETGYVRRLNPEEAACEKHFQESISRDREGRYIVSLPFNDQRQFLGESRSRAINRLLSIERRLKREPALGVQYSAVLQEYLDLGHMTKTEPQKDGYYLPHHAVIKEGSLTTKVRVVFDGSAKTSSGVSLNDTLLTGPTIQDDIFALLLRFRSHRYVLTGDIEKMYRQVLVRPEDRKYQQILWRDAQGTIQTYQLNTVTFGLSAAPYLAIRSLHALSNDEGHRFPQAAEILKRDLYVDDLLTGTQTREEAIILRDEIDRLLKFGGFNLRQWASNEPDLLAGLPTENVNLRLQLGESATLKTLGVFWNSRSDNITYTVKLSIPTQRVSKRIILSETAKVFDPLGILGPVIIVAKTLLQRLWALKLHWDAALPTEIHTEWINFYEQLSLLNDLSFKRGIFSSDTRETQLHGFCDASQTAYGACIYWRSIAANGHAQVHLLCAKSRVAPLKQVSIPRLELCGAQLLANLMSTVRAAIRIEVDRVTYWTDSTVVLHWLNTTPQRLQTFVANRVADIQSKTTIQDWRHVRTHDNPADFLSRGQLPRDFLQPSIWQQGPSWLQTEEATWPVLILTFPAAPLEERKNFCFATAATTNDFLGRYSSITKLQRIMARCLRFNKMNKNTGPLTISELTTAHDRIMRLVQESAFPIELKALKTGENHKTLSKIAKLNPFLDKNGIMRVGGRLRNAIIPFSQRHPIILPKNHHVTKMIIEHEHRLQLHAGPQSTLCSLRRRYWPLDGRNLVRKIIRPCLKCFRQKPPSVDYVMGNLPGVRVTECRPFTNVGVDYCGPFFIKEKRHRNRNRIKVYVAVFTCMVVKAVHLEVVSDLTTEAFIAALRRFIARRGFCINIYSDNGTNFVGANTELREIHQLLQSEAHKTSVNEFLTEKSIAWHFTPPRSPHFGGLWEAAVKSFKHHLKRIVGIELLTFEDLNTLVIEIEAVLNSRPLTPISSDPNDPLVLTPGHFLIGDALTSAREVDLRDTPVNRLSSWQHVQYLKQHFWTRWHREYISELNLRTKWVKGEHFITEGTLVLLKEDNLPPLQWAMGRVVKIHPGTDGIIRAVTIKTAKGTFDRNVKKLAPLPIDEDDDFHRPRASSTTNPEPTVLSTDIE